MSPATNKVSPGPSTASSVHHLRAQREIELNALVSLQHPLVRNVSRQILSIPHIKDSVFYGFALRWPQTYIAYLVEVLSQSGRLPAALHSWTPAPHPELQDQLTHLHTSALIHRNRIPAGSRPVLANAVSSAEPDTVIFTKLRTRLLARLFYLRGIETFASVVRDNFDAWMVFISDIESQCETDLWELAIPTAVDVAVLRNEYARLVGSGVLPPMEQTIQAFRESRSLANENGGEDIAMNFGVLAREPVTVASDGKFPGFSKGDQITHVHEGEQVFNFGTECIWCSAKLLKTGEDAALYPDGEPLRTLPCSHIVGAFCFEVAGKDNCPVCCANV